MGAKWYTPWLAEAKVLAASGVTFVVSLVVGVLTEVQSGDLPVPGPAPVAVIVVALIPTVLAYLAGFQAKHASRPDLEVVVSPTAPNKIG